MSFDPHLRRQRRLRPQARFPGDERPVELVLPRAYWERGLERLLGLRRQNQPIHARLCATLLPDRQCLFGTAPWTARASAPTASTPTASAPAASATAESEPDAGGLSATLTLTVFESPADVQSQLESWTSFRRRREGDVLLATGTEGQRGRLRAWRLGERGIQAIPQIRLPGRGMHRIPEPHQSPLAPIVAFPASHARDSRSDEREERWSRTIGALGADVWQRLTRLRVGLVGCGRLGSLLAHSLARTGVAEFVLVDPDRVERHNLGESAGWTQGDVGRPKAEALASRLQDGCPWVRVADAVDQSVTTEGARQPLRACDVLVCCADAGSARLATGLLAALYHQPLLDVGSGVFSGRDAGLDIGGEVRLLVPGRGCLSCLGSTADPASDHALLGDPDAEAADRSGRTWSEERAGSLRSWNAIVAGLAQRALETLVEGRLEGSLWWRLQWGGERSGAPFRVLHQTQVRPTGRPSGLGAPASSGACFCAFAGLADSGLPRVQEWIRRSRPRPER
jgi:molybdopterin/thiamine biosynthesis adenylyltransferase